MKNEKILQLYNQFNRIHSQFSVVKRQFVCNDYEQPLFPAEMQVLAILNERPNSTVTDIASILYMTKSAASQIVKKLCAKGFMEKQRDPKNERVVILKLTTQGNGAVKDFTGKESEALEEVIDQLDSFSETEFHAVELFLNALEKTLDKRL